MSKKPSPKPEHKKTLKQIVRAMILEESAITKEPEVANMDFIFTVQAIKNVLKSPTFTIIKPSQEHFIEIGCRINIDPTHLAIFNADPKKRDKLFSEIKKICFIKNVIYLFQPEFFVLLDRIYLESNKPLSMNQFRKTFKNILNSVFYVLEVFKDIDPNVVIASGDIIKRDPTLYT